MTAHTIHPTGPAPAGDSGSVGAAAARPGEPRARFRDLLASELLKLWSLRSLRWVFGISAVLLVLFNANAAYADYDNWPHYGAQIRADFVPWWADRDAFSNNAGITMMLLAGSLGAIAVVGEYSSGMVRATFAAVPARRALMAAKLVVVTAVMTAYGAVIAGASFWASQAILSQRHIGISITCPGVVRPLVVSALLAPLSAVIGMGLGALIRHSATTMVVTAGVLLLLPNLLTDRHRWIADLHHALPLSAWQRLNEIPAPGGHPGNPFPATDTGSWLVYALWPLAAVLVTLFVVGRRDL